MTLYSIYSFYFDAFPLILKNCFLLIKTNLITGEGEASVPSTPDILMDLLFLPQAVAVAAAE